jgi:Flp pilus assembly protein TadD
MDGQTVMIMVAIFAVVALVIGYLVIGVMRANKLKMRLSQDGVEVEAERRDAERTQASATDAAPVAPPAAQTQAQVTGANAMSFQGIQTSGGAININIHSEPGATPAKKALSPERVPGNRSNLRGTGAPNFVGRDADLQRIREHLNADRPLAVTAVHGLGGVGKSELAWQFAFRHQNQYPGGVCWIDAAQGTDAVVALVTFGRDYLECRPPDGVTAIADQLTWLYRQWPCSPTEPALVIFDNVDDWEALRGVLPPPGHGFQVLCTSRLTAPGDVCGLSLHTLAPDAAFDLLCRSAIRNSGDPLPSWTSADQEAARTLCDCVGHLPLAIILLGRQLARRRGLSLATLRHELNQGADVVLRRHRDDGYLPHPSVQAAFELTWRCLDTSAQTLAGLLAQLAPAPIPWSLVQTVWDQVKPADAVSADRIRDDELAAWSLITVDEDADHIVSVRIHPLVRDFFAAQHRQHADADKHRQALATALVEQSKIVRHPTTLAQVTAFRPYAPHLAVLLPTVVDDEILKAHTCLSWFHAGAGNLSQAQQVMDAGAAACRQRLGDEHPDTLTSMNNLAGILRARGDLSNAQSWHEQDLSVCRRVLGDEHPDTLTSMNNLAGILQDRGDLSGAQSLQEQVLSARRRVLGEEHPDTLTSMNNLGEILRARGDLSGAQSLHEEELSACRRVLDEEHPHTLTSMNNLAGILWDRGDLSGAQSLQEQVLSARRRILGEEHQDTLTSMNNLAVILRARGDLSGAQTLQEQVLSARRRVLGEDHPNTLISMNNLAVILWVRGDLSGAQSLQEQVLFACRRVLGEEHSDTLISMCNLAGTFFGQNRFDDARLLVDQALSTARRTLGDHHEITRNLTDLSAHL